MGNHVDTQQPTDIVNKGRIVSFGASGSAINETFVAGDYKITNSGSIIGVSFHAIDLDNKDMSGGTGGIHTINSGVIDAPVAIFSDAFVTEKVTNSGSITGDVSPATATISHRFRQGQAAPQEGHLSRHGRRDHRSRLR
ncbi:MAG: hypothetical protein R3D30_01045 [Hyphomicrobiales bacterium]